MPRGATYDPSSGYKSRLPGPRQLSTTVFKSTNISDPRHSHMLMQFGQFLDHDITSTPNSGKKFMK